MQLWQVAAGELRALRRRGVLRKKKRRRKVRLLFEFQFEFASVNQPGRAQSILPLVGSVMASASSDRTIAISRGASIPIRTEFGLTRTTVITTSSPMQIRSFVLRESTSIAHSMLQKVIHDRWSQISQGVACQQIGLC